MKISTSFLIVAASVVTLAATTTQAKPLIVGGSLVPVGDKTYTAGLRISAAGETFCGGSLITPSHVLTAAHCIGPAKYVTVGSQYLKGSRDGQRIAIKKATRHPSYDPDTSSFDFGIIELATPVTKSTPVKPIR